MDFKKYLVVATFRDVVTGLVFTGDEFEITVAKGDNIIEIINHGTANNLVKILSITEI